MLAEKLLKIAPVPMARVRLPVLGFGGERHRDQARLVLLGRGRTSRNAPRSSPARWRYHGNTCAAVSLSGKPDMHAGFGLPFAPFKHTEFPHYYRRHEPGESEREFSTRMAEALEKLIEAEGPETIAAFFAEPVMGAGGAIVPPQGYFEKMQAVLRKYDILFVADEVICGFARTGEMWGSQTYGLRPDMMTSAKALSAAMQPISAVLINERIHDAMLAQSDKFGNFAHGYTYAGHPVAAAVALEVQKIYAEMDIVARAKRLAPCCNRRSAGSRRIRSSGDVRGVGLILGMELMRDGEKRIPFDWRPQCWCAGRGRRQAARAYPARGRRPTGVCSAAGHRSLRNRRDRRAGSSWRWTTSRRISGAKVCHAHGKAERVQRRRHRHHHHHHGAGAEGAARRRLGGAASPCSRYS